MQGTYNQCTHLTSEIIQYELTTVLAVLFTEFAIEIQCKYRLLKLLFIARLSEDAAAIIFKDALEFILIEIGQYRTTCRHDEIPKPHNWKYGKEFRKDLSALIDSFRCEGNPRIYLCYPATVYGTKWGINDSTIVHGVIPAIKKTARRKKVKIIDLHTPTSGMPENFPDRVHPNANGARILAQTVYQAITSEKKR